MNSIPGFDNGFTNNTGKYLNYESNHAERVKFDLAYHFW